jgi:hypothetical protein
MTQDRPEIRQWLAEKGYPPAAIEKILLRLDRFDSQINRDSLFDAMETGELDMDSLIKDALKEK